MPLERAVSARPSATRRASPSGGRPFTLPVGRELGSVCRGLQTRTEFRRTPPRSGQVDQCPRNREWKVNRTCEHEYIALLEVTRDSDCV